MLQQFSEEIIASKLQYDYCLVAGDIANCDYNENKHN